ncbi:hypothetical protein F5Y14DRAFT_424854 [Nemania sp. NC0429]|nr:hypothetical protein F5Y14DRAFT_424854 [Nemania sp. NC0429]
MASQSSNASTSFTAKIESAPEEFVRAVLVALCHDYDQRGKIMEYLSTLEYRQAEDYHYSDESSDEKSVQNKAKAPSPFRICVRCEDAFREEENRPDVCPYHPGELYVNEDSDVWDDWEDWREGDPRSEENKKAYPEGYIWDCCKKRGDDEEGGCLLGSHMAVE